MGDLEPTHLEDEISSFCLGPGWTVTLFWDDIEVTLVCALSDLGQTINTLANIAGRSCPIRVETSAISPS
jgi:hypothetical protein